MQYGEAPIDLGTEDAPKELIADGPVESLATEIIDVRCMGFVRKSCVIFLSRSHG